MEIAAILQQPDDRWKPLLQFPEWPFIKVEKPLLASSSSAHQAAAKKWREGY